VSVPFAPGLLATLEVAKEAAESRRHHYVEDEHFLYGMLAGEEGATILRACGANPPELAQELLDYLELLPEGLPRAAVLSPSLAQLLEAASWHVERSGGTELTLGFVLGHLFRPSADSNGYASALLYSAGIDRVDLLRAIGHGSVGPLEIPAGDWLTVRFHNDEFTTMEFVVHVLELVFGMTLHKAQERMLCVHKEGSAVMNTYRRADAIERATEVIDVALKAGFPLRVTLEPAE
jgi:ATP-dependent Clp protease adaptor protein ClpS